MSVSKRILAGMASLLFLLPTGTAWAEDTETLEQLESLTVTEEKFPGYDSDFSFKFWIDADGNGCDERVDNIRKYVKGGFEGCTFPDSGVITDPYSGLEHTFPSEDLESLSGIDIDHIVSRSDAWQTGMANRSQEERDAFANDQLNLVPTKARINRSKSDKTPGKWLSEPLEKSGLENRCLYAQRYVKTKHKYGLSLGRDDFTALKDVLSGVGCTPNGDVPYSSEESKELYLFDRVLTIALALIVLWFVVKDIGRSKARSGRKRR